VDTVVVGAEDALSGVDAAGVGALVEVVLVAVGVGVEVVLAVNELVTSEGELVAVGVGVEVVLAVNELVTAGVEVEVEDALRRANSCAFRIIALLELKDG
jgi:hypothetical protein